MPKHSARAALLLTTILFAAPVAAQDTAASGTFLGKILYAFGLPRIAIDTPQAVTVIEQEDLDNEQAETVGEVLDNVPGVQAAGGDSPLGLAFNIRGVGLTEQPASEARISVKVDGAPKFYEQYRMGSFFSDVELYKRVEILRGPASATLYGSGAYGGVVEFTTKDAADFLTDGRTSAVRTKLSFGSNGNSQLASVIMANDWGDFETIAAFNWRTSDDYKDGDGNTVLATGGESLSGLIKGTWHLGDNTVRLSFQQWQSSLDDSPLAATGGNSNVGIFGLTDRDTTDRTVVLSWENHFEGINWLNLRAQVSMSDTTVSQSNHQDTSGFGLACAAGTFAVLCDAEYGYKTWNLKVENSADFAFGDWTNHLTTGIEYTRTDRTAETSIGALGFHPEGVDKKTGVYVQSEFVWRERLTLVPGLRVDFVSRKAGAGVPGGSSVDDTAISPKLALHYRFNDTFSMFGSVARTERLPTLDELYSYSTTQAPAISLEKETSFNAELGFAIDRQDLFMAGDSLQLKLTAFQNRVNNLIQRTASSQPVYFENVGEALFRGVELEAGYEADRFFGRLAYSHVVATDETYDYRLSSNPADQLALTLGGRLPEKGIEYGWRGTFVNEITTASRSTSGTITETSYGGYVLHDLFLRWKPEDGRMAGLSVDFSVENVFDIDYRNNLAMEDGRGRTFKVTLAKTW